MADPSSRGVPLRRWIREESERMAAEQRRSTSTTTTPESGGANNVRIANLKKRSFLSKATVAYGLVELLGRATATRPTSTSTSTTTEAATEAASRGVEDVVVVGREQPSFGIDNFVVYVARGHVVAGVRMISPPLSARMVEPSFLSGIIADENNGEDGMGMGRYLEVEIMADDAAGARSLPQTSPDAAGAARPSNGNDCRLFGMLLYELYSGIHPSPAMDEINLRLRGSVGDDSVGRAQDENNHGINSPMEEEGPARKKLSSLRYDKRRGKSYSTAASRGRSAARSDGRAPPLLSELGCPSSVCALARRLMMDGDDGNEAYYPSLDEVKSDVHLLVCDPECFLFDREDSPAGAAAMAQQQQQQQRGSSRGTVPLRVKRGKLYGREDEVSSITEAYCQVSSGKNAAVFIGGYSGSGKTMLVQSLTARVDVNGGYVLSQKVDKMTKEQPLMGVLSAFDRLCLLVRDKCPPNELLDISNRLARDFESDCSVLARLLPNVVKLLQQPSKTAKDADIELMMNLHTVGFTLRRFMRILSSKMRPVMLFLDDLQWAASPTLELVEALLSDGGSGCFFFVGSYRDNEVRLGHPVLELMSTISAASKSPIYTMSLNLSGLKRDDLNIMIAETLGIFPRLCKPLSDIVFSKTKGSPLFALEFLRSLVDSRLLKYSLRERRWIWDECKIADENITDNVLYLLTAKMKSLPGKTQLALRILSCFGIKTEESVVAYLSSTPQYSDFSCWLENTIEEGCVQKAGSEFKFVHDKVREAAYGLIPENKNEFHHSLGMSIISSADCQDLGGSALFQVVDQINHGIPSLIQPTSRMDIVELNSRAGQRAMGLSDFETAKSYLNNALTLLPKDPWNSNYNFILRLFFLTANAAYSCGNIDVAYDSLKKIIEKGRCIEDKLDAYHLYATILHACEESGEAYTICCKVLSQLGESITNSVENKKLAGMVKETGRLLKKKISDGNEFLEMKEIDGVLRFTFKFYTLLMFISFWKNPEMMAFYGCRMIQLTLEHSQVCQDSVLGLVQYAAVLCQRCKLTLEIKEADRIATAAMSLFEQRFFSSEIVPRVYVCYYGFVADRTHSIQMCSKYLRKGFEVSMSAGDSSTAFLCLLRLTTMCLIGGENLSTLLKETDHHLEIMARLHLKLPTPGIVAHRETISTLTGMPTGTVQSTSTQNNDSNPSDENTETNAEYAQSHNRAIYLNRVLQSFWLGHSQRCNHYAKKALKTVGGHTRIIVLFHAALNAFRGIKNNNGNGSPFIKAKALYKNALTELKNAAGLCPWNFRNKVFLLEAEMFSFEQKSEDAKSSYAAAITSSCSSRFVHEEGLSCELAALHRLKVKEVHAALDFFQRAKECYSRWGSQMKVDFITQQMEKISSTQHLRETVNKEKKDAEGRVSCSSAIDLNHDKQDHSVSTNDFCDLSR